MWRRGFGIVVGVGEVIQRVLNIEGVQLIVGAVHVDCVVVDRKHNCVK